MSIDYSTNGLSIFLWIVNHVPLMPNNCFLPLYAGGLVGRVLKKFRGPFW